MFLTAALTGVSDVAGPVLTLWTSQRAAEGLTVGHWLPPEWAIQARGRKEHSVFNDLALAVPPHCSAPPPPPPARGLMGVRFLGGYVGAVLEAGYYS